MSRIWKVNFMIANVFGNDKLRGLMSSEGYTRV